MPPPSSSLPLWRDERSLLVRKILKSSRPTSSGDCSRESDGSFSGSSGYVGLGDGSIVYKPIQSLTASCEVSSHTHGVFPSCASPAGGILSLHAIRERDDEDLSSSSSSSSASSSSSLSSSVKEKEEMRDTEDVKKRKSVMKEVLPSQQSTTISCINHADLELNETDAEEDEEEEEDEENREVEKTMIGREDACLNPGVYTPDDGSGGRHYESLNKTGGRGDIFSSLTLDRFYRKDLQQEEEKRMQETKHISQVSRQKPSSSSGVHTPHGQHHKDISPSSSTTKPTRISSSSSSSSSSCAEDYATYQRVRLQLLSLQYHESFDPVNTRLVDRLLQDVVKAVENFQILMKRYRDAESQLGEQKKVLSMAVNARDHLRSEVSRLKENLKQSERELKRKEKEWTEEKRKKDAYVGSLEEILKKKKEDLYTTHTKLRRLREQYTLIKEEVEKNAPRYGYARKDYSLHLTLPLKSNNRRHHLDAPASTFHQHYHNSKNRRPSLPPRSQPSSCRLRRFSTASEKRREEEEELLSPSEEERKQGEEELLNEEKNESSDADKEDEEEEEETTDRQEKYSSGTEKRNRDRRESAKEESKYLQSELLKYKALAEKLRLKLDARQDYSSLSSQAKEEDEEEKKKKKKEDGEERDGLFESEDRENYWRDQAMKKEEEILHISQQFNHLNSLYQALRLRSKPMRGVKGFSLSSSSSSSSSFCKKPRLLSRGGPGPPSYPQHLLKKHSSSLLSSSSPAFPTQAKKRIPRREGDKKEGKEKSPAIPRDKKNAESKSRMTGKERDRKEEEEDEEVDKGEDDDEKKKKRKEKFVKDKKKTDIDGIEEEEEGQKVKNDKEEEDEEGKDRVKALTYSLATAQSRYEEACKELSRYQQLLLQEASIHKKTQDKLAELSKRNCELDFLLMKERKIVSALQQHGEEKEKVENADFLRERVSYLSQEKQRVEEQLASLSLRLEELLSLHGEKEKDLHDVKEKYEKEKQRREASCLLIQQLEATVTETQRSLEEIEIRQKESLEKERISLRLHMERDLQTLQQKLEESEASRRKIEEECVNKTKEKISFDELEKKKKEHEHEEMKEEISELEHQAVHLSSLLLRSEERRQEEVKTLHTLLETAKLKAEEQKKESEDFIAKERLKYRQDIDVLQAHLLQCDQEKDSLRRELDVKEEELVEVQKLLQSKQAENKRMQQELKESREAGRAMSENLMQRLEQGDTHLKQLQMEKQLLQQQIATLQGELQTFAQTAEANRQLMDELEQLQREKGSLQQSQAAQTQLMEELRSLQERCVQTAAVCSELALERTEAMEKVALQEKRNSELEIELTLLADRQSHLLHELGRSKRLQEHAERDYLFLLSQMEGFTEQIALRQTRESTPHLSSSSLPYSSSYQMKNGLPPSHENSASSSSSTDGAGRVALAVVSSSSSIETG